MKQINVETIIKIKMVGIGENDEEIGTKEYIENGILESLQNVMGSEIELECTFTDTVITEEII